LFKESSEDSGFAVNKRDNYDIANRLNLVFPRSAHDSDSELYLDRSMPLPIDPYASTLFDLSVISDASFEPISSSRSDCSVTYISEVVRQASTPILEQFDLVTPTIPGINTDNGTVNAIIDPIQTPYVTRTEVCVCEKTFFYSQLYLGFILLNRSRDYGFG